ncbi:MAG: hypothetical protein FVQ82_10095 [Planctomycetes bacterium]|nr:hypothetical protein [Planctomycetota bacterium]
MKLQIQFLTLVLIAFSVPANALITVRPSGGDFNNLQDAVNAATGTETILVGDGTYTGPKNRDILLDKNGIVLTIESENGAENCVIDAQGLGQIFFFSNINGADSVTLGGLTLTNASSTYINGGGAIFNHNSVLTIENCIISNCVGTKGGALISKATFGSLTMDDCVITNNRCTYSSGGGGICIVAQTAVITNSTISKNYVPNPTMHAGGFYAENADVTFTNCLLEGNSAYGSGGLFFNTQSDVTFEKCTITGNRCTANGGVGFVSGNSTSPATVTLKNSILYNNSADGLSDLFRMSGSNPTDTVITYSFSNLDSTQIGGFGFTENNLGGNINVDPLFAIDGYWKGDTWVSGDYHLQSMVGRYDTVSSSWVTDEAHSPCIDAGDPADDYPDEPAPNGERLNMGFYANTSQASKSPYCQGTLLADLNNDCHVGLEDFAIMAAEWLQCDKFPQSMCW